MKKPFKYFLKLIAFTSIAVIQNTTLAQGVLFNCQNTKKLEAQMLEYLEELRFPTKFIKFENKNKKLAITLTGAEHGNTLRLAERADLSISDDIVVLYDKNGPKAVKTVSKKEIVAALFTPGRTTEFDGAACNIEAFKDQVGVRQNIVAWAQTLEWGWPDGDYAKFNEKHWKKGTPITLEKTPEALADAFLNQDSYSIGCYTASKLVYTHAIFDYYRRVIKDERKAAIVLSRLLRDKDPLVNIEPGEMWHFEEGQTIEDDNRPGKLLKLHKKVSPKHFVPGDWSYILNTDAASYEKIGYEGSNAIYLGRNKFDDYYNDNNYSYTYEEKLNEVFQWRNGVFSRARDADKSVKLNESDFERLSQSPYKQGLVMTYRAVPYYFGYEKFKEFKN